jgi:hypothetical protein
MNEPPADANEIPAVMAIRRRRVDEMTQFLDV